MDGVRSGSQAGQSLAPGPAPSVFVFEYLFTWLAWVLGEAHGVFTASCGTVHGLSGWSQWAELPRGMCDLSSPTGDGAPVSCVEGQVHS